MAHLNVTPEVTVSEFSDLTGIARHCVAYAIDAHGVKPVRKVGQTRTFNRDDLVALLGTKSKKVRVK